MSEVRGVNWDLEGTQLHPYQAANYLYNAGFTDAPTLLTACAVMAGESDWWLKAWHVNDGGRDPDGKLIVKSVDLGWIQRNVPLDTPAALADADVKPFVHDLFTKHPDLEKPLPAAKVAHDLWKQRGFKPWVAYLDGGWQNHIVESGLAVANFLAVEFGLGQSFYEIHKAAK